MRRLLAIFLSVLLSVVEAVGLLSLSQTSAYAQTAAYAEVSGISAQNFPQVTALLDVYDANGEFMSGLQPSAITVYEDGQPRPVDKIAEAAPPAQIVTAINPGPALAVRDANGTPRFNGVVSALTDWVNALPEGSQDDLSLVSLTGSLINHAAAKDWRVSLQSFKPDFRNTTPNLQSLAIALDTVNAKTAQPGMKRAVLFITPHLDDPNLDNRVAPLIQKAIDSKVRVFVWFVDADTFISSPSANAFKLLALQTNGSFFAYSGKEAFPDLNAYFAPLRHIYTITYTSALNASGDHKLGLYVESGQGQIPALDKTFSVDIQPPNPILVAPPSQITRQPPADDPYNKTILVPERQEIDIIVEFPDGHKRPLRRTTLYVDGQAVAHNVTEPFDVFTWDLSLYAGSSGQRVITVEVEDALGLKKSSMGIPVKITIVQPPSGIRAWLARYRTYIVLGAIALAGAALIAILLRGRRRGPSTMERIEIRKHLEDPLTQPVAAITEPVTASRKVRTQPRKAPAPNWIQAKAARVQEAHASLIRLTNGGEPASVAPIPLAEKEMTFGTDPVQAMRVLDDPTIAPLHARIKQTEDGSFIIYDHGSVAGTWVNYELVTREGCRLRHGDRIHFGQLHYRFDLNQPPAESEPQVIRQ